MKHMNRIFALVLALIMVLGLATTAYAATNNSITVNNAVKNETYKIYKMFDLVVNDETNPTEYSYTLNAGWAAFFAAANGETPAGAGYQYVTINNAGYVTAISDAAALAKAAAAWAGKPAATATKEASSDTVVFENLANGYWLITSSLGTVAMTETTPDKNAVTVDEKNKEDTIEKKVKEDSTGAFGKKNDAQIGDTVEFMSTATLVPNTTNVKIYDAMDDGLTLNKNSIMVDDLAEGTEYTVELDKVEGEVTYDFVITFTQAYLDTLNANTELEITYTAVLNENAVTNNAITDQKNKTQITYGDKQSVEDQTETTTHKFSVLKYANGVENVHLADAVFSLKKAGAVVKLIKIDDNNYRVANVGETGTVDTFKTVADGDIVIWGVDADDDYTLLETEAPAGYNKLTAEVNVTVNEDNATQVKVENKMGSTLPSTGGMGTTLFYVIGGLLVAAAVVLLVSKKRMTSAE